MLFLIFSVISAFPCIAVCQTQQLNLSRVTTTLETRWLASLIPTAFSPQFVSEKCHNDSLTYLDSILRLNQDWARKMLDASGKLSDIDLSTNKQAMGQFDQCLTARGPHFQAKYCTSYFVSNNSELFIQFLRTSAILKFDDAPLLLFHNTPAMPNKTTTKNFNLPSIGLCIPASCSSSDVSIAMYNILEFYNRKNDSVIPFNVATGEQFCYTKSQSVVLDTTEIVISATFSAFAAIILSGTCIEMWRILSSKQDSEDSSVLWIRMILCFSLVNNTHKLFSTKLNTSKPSGNNSSSPADLSCVYGIRFLLMLWVIFSHSFINGILQYNQNVSALLEDGEKWYWQIIANGTVAVDGFFLLSGLLVSYNLLRYLDKTSGKFNIANYFNFVLHRYLRLLPAYAAVFAFVATMFVHVGSGPHWFHINHISGNCRRAWWQHLLFINNFFPKDGNEQCMTESWFLAAEFQIFLVSPLLIYPLWRWKTRGCLLLFFVNSVVIVANLAFFAKTKMPPTSMITRPLSGARSLTDFWGYYYPQPWFRSPPYLVGILLGYLLHSKQGQTILIKKNSVTLAWIASCVTVVLVIFGLSPYLKENEVPSINFAISVIYGALHRFAFAAAFSWVIFGCVHNYGGVVNSILSYSFFGPMAKLSYCIYLVHYNVIIAYYAQKRQSPYYTTLGQFYLACGHLSVSVIISLVLYLAIEMPFNNLEKILFSRSNAVDHAESTPFSKTSLKKVDGKINRAFIL